MLGPISFNLNSVDDNSIYRSYFLNAVDKEHRVAYAFHTRYGKKGRFLLRKFQLGCIANLSRFDPQYIGEYFVIYTYILEFLDDFLTEEAMDYEKVSDERMLDFFAYAYGHLAFEEVFGKQPRLLNYLYSKIEILEKYDPEIFNTKKHPQVDIEIAKLIAHLREKGLNVSNDIYENYYSANFGFVKNYTSSPEERKQAQKSKDEEKDPLDKLIEECKCSFVPDYDDDKK